MAAAAPPPPPLAAATPPPNQHAPPTLVKWTVPSLPATFLTMLNPFANNLDADPSAASTKPTANDATQRSILKRPILATIPINDHNRGPPSPSRSSGSVMFAEPETTSNSDAGSRDGSVGARRAKKTAKPKTQFSICHPAPESKTRQKLHRRPRSLMQLHRLSATARPRPALDVIPSANFSVRMNRAIAKVFRAKHSLCTSDLVVLKAEKYTTEEADEEQEARDVIGLICKGRKDEDKSRAGKVTIHLASGETWEAYQATNGGYEFTMTDEHGLDLTVRWVPKKAKARENGKISTKHTQRRFNFSTISPNSRKHPVIASLSSTGLDINDVYKIPNATAVTPLSTPKQTGAILEDAMEDEVDEAQQHQCETDDRLRVLVTLTGIFVAFKEGWSPSFKYDGKDGASALVSPSKSSLPAIATPPGSPIPHALEKHGSIRSIGSGIIRRSSALSRSNRNSTASVPEGDESEPPSRSNSIIKSGRGRADSSSTVLVHRAAGNRRKNNQPAPWRPDLDITHDPLPEASREDLSRDSRESAAPREAAKPSPFASGNTPQGFSSSRTPSDGSTKPEVNGQGPNASASSSQRSRQASSVIEKIAKRESTSTTDVDARRSVPSGMKSDKTRRKRASLWRRILCGGKAHDL